MLHCMKTVAAKHTHTVGVSYNTHIPIKLDVIPGAAAVAAATAAAIAATNMIAKQRKSLISKFETKRPSAPSRLTPPRSSRQRKPQCLSPSD